MEWLRRLLTALAGVSKIQHPQIYIEPLPEEPPEEPAIALEPIEVEPSVVTQAMLRDAWPQAIKHAAGLDARVKTELRKRPHALTWTDGIAELFVDDEELLAILQRSDCRADIERALAGELGIRVPFQATGQLIIRVQDTIEPGTTMPHDIARVALEFFKQSGLFSPFRPEGGGVYPLPESQDGAELQLFQVRKEPSAEKNWPKYADVFCILALTDQSIAHTAGEVFRRLSQEPAPIARDRFFLIVPYFPAEGIHLLTRPFDFASEKVIPVPFDVPTLEEAISRSQCSETLKDGLYYWLNRINRYRRTSPVTGPDYYGRSDKERDIRSRIKQGQAFGLFGPRRMGKSSILLEMRRRRAFGHACVCVLNMQMYLRRSIWAVFPEAMQEWLQYLNPETAVGQQNEFPLAKMRIAPEERLDQKMLQEEIQRLIGMLPDKMRLVLILDEVGEILPQPPDYQQAAFPDWKTFLAFLRVLYSDPGGRFVLGVAAYGSEIRDSKFGRTDPNFNPWYLQIDPVPVGPLDRPACDQMVQDIGAMTGVYYTPEALELLYASTGGHPQIIRELCAMLTEGLRDRPHTVEAEEVDRVLQQYVSAGETTRAMYIGLLPKEQQIVRQLAESDRTKDDLYAALTSSFEGDVDFEETLSRLSGYGLIDKVTTGNVHLKFGLFRQYLVGLPRSGEER